MGPANTVKIKLLGGFSATLASGVPVKLAGKKNRALLAYLAMGRGRRQGREKLMALLWSDRGEVQARGSLRQALSALKEALAAAAPAALVLEGDSVTLDPGAVATDVAEFETLAGSTSTEDVRQAAGLYEGDLLDGLNLRDPGFEDWLLAERAQLHEVAIGALGRLTAETTGPETVAMGKRLVALDPLREASHRALMQAYAGAGEKALALQQYARCRDLLKAELGVAPARETEELRLSLLREEESAPTVAPTGVPARSAAPNIISIAVMPFANMSGDDEQEYFADGLTEDLITALSKSRHLHVIARNTTFQYKNKALSAQQVGREIGARYVVEGSVRRSTNRVRVTAQLIDPESDAHLWAERFDRELADIFAVQDEIVQAISAQLGFALIEAAVTGRRSAPTASLTAYDHLLRGRSAWRRGAVIETRDHYLKAVEADPNYAAALACLAFFYSEDIYMQVSGEPVEDLARLADDFAARAIAADDGDSYTHHMVGTAMGSLGKHPEARHHLELALSLNPYYVNTTINLGWVIAFAGQHREGLAMVERVFELEPRLAPAMRAVPLWIRCAMGDPDGAIRDLHKIDQPMACYHLVLAVCLAGAGRAGEAQAHVGAFEAGRSAWFDVPGFAHWFCKMLALPADQERFLRGVRALGYKV
jgi:TolB-like protein/DNA-binding SARP family transcriptional activator